MSENKRIDENKLLEVSGGKAGSTYYVDKSKCVGCGTCAKKCPTGAAALKGGKSEINPAKCAHCGTCMKSCPMGAVSRK